MKNLLFKQVLPSWIRWVFIGIFILFLVFPISPLAFFAAVSSVYFLPFIPLMGIFFGLYCLYSREGRTKFSPLIFILVSILIIFVSFKLGIFWLSWLFLFILSLFLIYLSFKSWAEGKVVSKVILGSLILISFLALFYPLNPFASMWGFFGTGKLIANHNYPCENCQKENWECNLSICKEKMGIFYNCPQGTCDDFKNIKNCYCCECINNFKHCQNCLLNWNNSHCCNPITGKCVVGW